MYSNSPLGRSVAFMRYKYGVKVSNNLSSNVALIYSTHDLFPNKLGLVRCAKDALDFIQESAWIEHFTCHEMERILDICVE